MKNPSFEKDTPKSDLLSVICVGHRADARDRLFSDSSISAHLRNPQNTLYFKGCDSLVWLHRSSNSAFSFRASRV